MPVPLKTGEVLRGRYKIAGIIGQGGMGSINLAEDTRMEGRQCALKEVEHDRSLPPDLLQEARDQFFRELVVFGPGRKHRFHHERNVAGLALRLSVKLHRETLLSQVQ